MPKSDIYHTEFTFPPFLTVGQFAAYQRAVQLSLAKLGTGETKTAAEALAVIFCAARDAGLLQNWKSETLPDVMTDDVNSAHAFVVLWVAQEVSEWLEKERNTDPKSFWRRLMSWTEKVRRLLIWLSAGVANVLNAFPALAGWLTKVKAK